MNRHRLIESGQWLSVHCVLLLFSIGIAAVADARGAEGQPAPGGAKVAEVYKTWPFDATEAARRQDETAKALGVAREVKLDAGGAAIEFVLIPAGKFMMGDAPGREVTIDKPFYLGKFLVTQAQYTLIMGKNPSKHAGRMNPADSIDWGPATEFAKKASEKAKKTIRLPSEAEWEWACRAGTATKCYWGDDVSKLGGFCWWHDNCGGHPNPVGKKTPNAFKLYDMMGNVWEWCSDGGPDAKLHPCRGATFGSKLPMFKSSIRMALGDGSNDRFGFRVAMDVE